MNVIYVEVWIAIEKENTFESEKENPNRTSPSHIL